MYFSCSYFFFQWVTSRSRSACGSVSGARDRRGQTGKLGDSPQPKPAQRLLLLLFRHRAKFLERNAADVVQHRVEVFNHRYKTFWGVKLTVFGPSCSQGFCFGVFFWVDFNDDKTEGGIMLLLPLSLFWPGSIFLPGKAGEGYERG